MTDNKENGKNASKAAEKKNPANTGNNVESKNKDSDVKKSTSKGSFIALLALIVAIAACVGVWWLWQQLQSSEANLKNTVNSAINTQSESAQTEIRKLMNELNHVNTDLGEKIDQQNQQFDTLKSDVDNAVSGTEQVAETLTALHSKLKINPKTGWLVAEAEYLLSLANQQLLLTANIDSGIAALRNADQRLRETGDPTLLDIRAQIADEITQLQSVVIVDVAGAALTLASLQTRVNELTLAGFDSTEETPQTTTDNSKEETTSNNPVRQGLNTALQSIKDLLSIKVRERGDSSAGNPLLTPDQRALIYQNLRLKLESARLSLIQRDTVTYKQSLDISKQWLNTYFDDNSKRSALKQTLNELESINLSISLPDITGSLDALRTWQREQSNSGE